jgi:outer membrane lipoprotein SlyB
VTGAASNANAIGCISGAVVGGVGAHVAMHKHAVLGAVAGCAVGHHMAVVAKRKKLEEKRAAMAGQPVPAHH